ncbi:MAG: DNA polymerase III subunit gamma/tau [Lactococcus raffinolactis]|uniref:DNA polymerase III subunit gamma/tau n=1 Tax=Pseudolactococcus raffinolactis TaxID=1366 RepID=UPI001109D307|nr:DNA polymerase III subunit gamma/tau [Lactococcus raffinolactis]MBW9331452.1 DNA polymerase III subunit gamma/tau [Lactococcus raffinolactis]MDG4962451.1 DNA polymerase III subunit gamma/tau [Lactococcus raffinolactis]MDN5413095.1 DNA polymerase III subunit gamma/tau [Lactococcus raffinolactis]MDN5414513.1 DNA polymerase III subunit gamma/tau [Lactococcus raffinolactis]MDN5472408.1 DNA polymerase III subunit gamma/tau [Lactococcus raffinolactis]
MSYQALYRKYRSQRFDEMVGQEVVARTLKNAIITDQISHAYLFSGPRGTGKTSAAKIFAKAINCPNQTDGEPCNTCEICQAVTNGSLEDVIEMDAASNNGVDEIRDIRDKSTYAPSRAKYKVYIIDEVHMLTTGAFNALLKTLEEPTENVVFVLATTEIQKIPATILSRVQRFAFRAITSHDITQHLSEVLTAEGVTFDEAAVALIANAADGGMRDALSTLDQALSFAENGLTLDVALLVTGAISKQALDAYISAIADQQVENALTQLDTIFADGKNMIRFTEDLMSHFRDMLLAETPTVNVSKAQVFAWIDIATETLQTLKNTTQEKIAADVMTMRLSEALKTADYSQVIADLQHQVSALTRQLESGQFQSTQAPQQTLPEKKIAPKAGGNYFSKDFVFKALSEATNEARQAIQGAWEEVINSFDSGFGKSMLQNTSAVAASQQFVVVTFKSEFTAQKATQSQDLQVQFGNFMSNIVGFAPEIIALTDADWLSIRTEYAQLRKQQAAGGDETPQAETAPEENGVVNQAQALFGDVVEVIED